MHICVAQPWLVEIFNTLWPSDAIWRWRSWSTLVQVMTCCLTAPSHYLNQIWLIIRKVSWHSSEGKFTAGTSAINHCNWHEKNSFEISLKSPRPQWVNKNKNVKHNKTVCIFMIDIVKVSKDFVLFCSILLTYNLKLYSFKVVGAERMVICYLKYASELLMQP